MNETDQEIPTYGAIAVETLADLMDAITSIVRIGMAGEPRAAIRHLSFTRFWADRLAELGDRQPSEMSLALLLQIDPREVARCLAPAWSLGSEADFQRGIELLQRHAQAFAREDLLHSPTNLGPMRNAPTSSIPKEEGIDPEGPQGEATSCS